MSLGSPHLLGEEAQGCEGSLALVQGSAAVLPGEAHKCTVCCQL